MFAAALIVAAPGATVGHALLVSSDPAAGTSVAEAPSGITLTFGEPPDPALSSVRVLDAQKSDRASGPPQAVPGDPASLRVPVGPLGDGVYTVSWRVVSADDAHVTAGSFVFGVGAGTVVATAPPTAGGGAPAGSPLASVMRLLLYAGLAGLLGSGLTGLLLHPRPPRRLSSFARIGWGLALVGTVGVVAVEWLDSGAAVSAFLGSALGASVVARLAMVLLAGGPAAWLTVDSRTAPGPTTDRFERWAYGAFLVLGGAGVVVDVLAGHAAAADQPVIAIGLQSVHGVAAGLWMGGLASLLVIVRGLPTEEKTTTVRRYSTVAGVLIVLVAATGIARAIQQVGTVDALLGSEFGRIVLLKGALLLGLGTIGAINRFVNVPAAATRLAGLRRWASAEVSVGLVVFAATAVLVNAVPPVLGGAQNGPPAPPVVAIGSDDAGTLRVRLTVTPGTAGFNDFSATIERADGSSPPAPSAVALRFSLASHTGSGQTGLDLERAPDGTFQGSGGNLSSDGIWQVTAVVGSGSGAVDVPIAVPTRVPAEPVASDPSISPVIYTVAMPGGTSAQVYLDPGRAGTNDLHVTIFDAAGKELPVPTLTIAIASRDQPGDVIQARQLEPGHFVATLDGVTGGSLTVDAVGPLPDGGELHAYLVMEVAP